VHAFTFSLHYGHPLFVKSVPRRTQLVRTYARLRESQNHGTVKTCLIFSLVLGFDQLQSKIADVKCENQESLSTVYALQQECKVLNQIAVNLETRIDKTANIVTLDLNKAGLVYDENDRTTYQQDTYTDRKSIGRNSAEVGRVYRSPVRLQRPSPLQKFQEDRTGRVYQNHFGKGSPPSVVRMTLQPRKTKPLSPHLRKYDRSLQ